jgi:hypothetical protein
MKSNLNIIPYRTWSAIPRSWETRPKMMNYNDPENINIHIEDGWRDVVRPDFDSETQRMGALIFDEANDVFTYEVTEIPQEELQQRIILQAQSAQQEAINLKIQREVIQQAQLIEDDEEALANQSLFPLWEDQPEGYNFGFDKKYGYWYLGAYLLIIFLIFIQFNLSLFLGSTSGAAGFKFDLIILSSVLEHLTDLNKAMKKIKRENGITVGRQVEMLYKNYWREFNQK